MLDLDIFKLTATNGETFKVIGREALRLALQRFPSMQVVAERRPSDDCPFILTDKYEGRKDLFFCLFRYNVLDTPVSVFGKRGHFALLDAEEIGQEMGGN